ncbi:hypothetical protein V498_07892, partial [Pseudogymnoascus sp. VKM F-4517 (FW-2822)]
MVDPLSVTASIIAVLQLTATLVSHVNDAKDAPSDQARFAKEAQSLSDLLTKLICRVNEGRDKSEGWYKEVWAFRSVWRRAGKTSAQDQEQRGTGEDRKCAIMEVCQGGGCEYLAPDRSHKELDPDCSADGPFLGQDREQNGRLLKWISSTDFPSQLSDIISRRQEGTGQWFLESTEFNNWLSGGEKTLFCPGIPGAGKTMVSAIAVDHLHKTTRDHSIGVAYVFCNYKVQKEQNTPGLLSAILKQLVQAQPAGAGAANALYKLHSARGTTASADEILNTLKLTLKHFATVYIVVDALDECSDEYNTPLRLLEKLRDLQNTIGIRLMVTSRFIPDIVGEFRSAPKLE